MATTTPNFGWPVPTSTDLVKDGATAIEALGDSIDASLLDLKGGTSGQVLAKNSNTDMDFIWVTDAAGDITGVTAGTGISGGGTSGTVTVTNSMATAIDAKGDLVIGTGADAFSRLAVGTDGHVLTAASAEATGVKWAAAASSPGVFRATKSANQSINTGAYTKITFNTETFDLGGVWDATNSKMIPTVAGYYQFESKTAYSISGMMYADPRKNGTSLGETKEYVTSDGTSVRVFDVVYLNGSTDYVELFIFPNANCTVSSGAESFFAGYLVRGA